MSHLPAKLHLRLAGKAGSGARAVIIALVGDFVVATIKFIAGYLSGSSAMVSEGVHTLIDASTEVILLYGLAVSRRRATPEHQLGFGREVYFWNFVVAILILALGAGIAFVAGLHQIVNPVPLENEWLNFVVLALSAVVEIVSLGAAFRKTSGGRGKQSLYRLLRRRRDPTSLTILFGGVAAVIGLLVTAIGLTASMLTGDASYDGLASIAIAAILAVTALKLAIESKALLIGVPADPEIVKAIIEKVRSNENVDVVNGLITVHLAPDQIVVALSVAFQDNLNSQQIEETISAIENGLNSIQPQIVALFIKPQSPERYAEVHGGGAPVTCYAKVQKVAATPYASM